MSAAGFAARQFGHVGVLFLRHQARAGGVRIVDRDETKFRAGPQDHVLGEPREMDAAERDDEEQFGDEIAVAHRIHAVAADLVEAELPGEKRPIEHDRGAGDRAAAERQHIEPARGIREAVGIALEHLDVGEQMMGEEDRLAALEMGVAGHDHLGVPGRALQPARAAGREEPANARRPRRGSRAACRGRSGRCGCARCGASRRRGRSVRSAPPRCSCARPRARVST